MAMRLRSRLVTCTRVSNPRCCSSRARRGIHGHAGTRRFRDVDGVDRTAQQLSSREQLREVDAPSGGVSSPVTTNFRAASRAARLSIMGRNSAHGAPFAGSNTRLTFD